MRTKTKTALGKATTKGTLEEMEALLKSGEDPNQLHYSRSRQAAATPLWWATRDPDRVRLLLTYGADQSIPDTKYHSLSIENARSRQHHESVVVMTAFALLATPPLPLSTHRIAALLAHFDNDMLAEIESGEELVQRAHNHKVNEIIHLIRNGKLRSATSASIQLSSFKSLASADPGVVVALAHAAMFSQHDALLTALSDLGMVNELSRCIAATQDDLLLQARICFVAWRAREAVVTWQINSRTTEEGAPSPVSSTTSIHSLSHNTQQSPSPTPTVSTTFIPLVARGLSSQCRRLLVDTLECWQDSGMFEDWVLWPLSQLLGVDVWQRWVQREIATARLQTQLLGEVYGGLRASYYSHFNTSVQTVKRDPKFGEFVELVGALQHACATCPEQRREQQQTNDLLRLYGRAVQLQSVFGQFIVRLSSKSGGNAIHIGLKQISRSMQKMGLAHGENQWRADLLLGIVQGAVEFSCMDQMVRFLRSMASSDPAILSSIDLHTTRSTRSRSSLSSIESDIAPESWDCIRIIKITDSHSNDDPQGSLGADCVVNFCFEADAQKHICELTLVHKLVKEAHMALSSQTRRDYVTMQSAKEFLHATGHGNIVNGIDAAGATAAIASPISPVVHVPHAPSPSRRDSLTVNSVSRHQHRLSGSDLPIMTVAEQLRRANHAQARVRKASLEGGASIGLDLPANATGSNGAIPSNELPRRKRSSDMGDLRSLQSDYDTVKVELRKMRAEVSRLHGQTQRLESDNAELKAAVRRLESMVIALQPATVGELSFSVPPPPSPTTDDTESANTSA